MELECSHPPGMDKLLNAEHESTPFNRSGVSESHILHRQTCGILNHQFLLFKDAQNAEIRQNLAIDIFHAHSTFQYHSI